MALRKVAIGMGDPAGIGPEIALKAALDPRVRGIYAPLLVAGRHALDIAGQDGASPEAVVEAVCRLVGMPLRRAA